MDGFTQLPVQLPLDITVSPISVHLTWDPEILANPTSDTITLATAIMELEISEDSIAEMGTLGTSMTEMGTWGP